MLTDYLPILFLLVFAIGFAGVNLALTHLIGPKKSTQSKLSVYESGVQPVGDTRQRISIRFGLVAMLFIIFDIEVVFLYPWAIVFKKFTENSGYFILIEMLVFIGILFLGYIYAWKKGGLSWD
jgi:NADH-quinone oxidoreductase subunit A